MSTSQKMYYCRRCQRQTVRLVEQPARVVHFLLGLFTFSLWWLVWLFTEGLGDKGASCTECGTVYESPGIRIDCRTCGEGGCKDVETCPHCGADRPCRVATLGKPGPHQLKAARVRPKRRTSVEIGLVPPPEEISDRRWKEACAELKVVVLCEKRGALILSGEVEVLVLNVADPIRQRLLNLPGRCLQQIAAETDRGRYNVSGTGRLREEELSECFLEAADDEKRATDN